MRLFSGRIMRHGGSDLIPRWDILIPRFAFHDPAHELLAGKHPDWGVDLFPRPVAQFDFSCGLIP